MTRTRTGCKTCKIRRVKCDEAKPRCRRCTSTGRTCDGYETELKQNLLIKVTDSPPPAHLPYIAYYRSSAAPFLSGPFDNELWATLLPQLCHSEPAVSFALSAFAASHKRLIKHGSGQPARPGVDVFEISQYNQAIRALRNVTTDADVVTGVCCLIFIGIECLYGNVDGALMHARHGAVMLNSSAAGQWRSKLRSALERFETWSTLCGDEARPACTLSAISDSIATMQIPQIFDTIDQARSIWDTLLTLSLSFAQQVGHMMPASCSAMETLRIQTQLLECFTTWRAAVEPLALTNEQVLRMGALKVQYSASRVWLETSLLRGEEKYAPYAAQFHDMVATAARLLKMRPQYAVAAAFVFDTGLIALLYFVATRCRDPLIRRSALQVMKYGPDRDGVWNTATHIRVAKRIIQLEEAIQIDNATERLRITSAARVQIPGHVVFTTATEGYPAVWMEAIESLPPVHDDEDIMPRG